MRVQIPAYMDRWMMGDRFGEVVRTVMKTRPGDPERLPWKEIAYVKLDKSGRTIPVMIDDCTPV